MRAPLGTSTPVQETQCAASGPHVLGVAASGVRRGAPASGVCDGGGGAELLGIGAPVDEPVGAGADAVVVGTTGAELLGAVIVVFDVDTSSPPPSSSPASPCEPLSDPTPMSAPQPESFATTHRAVRATAVLFIAA